MVNQIILELDEAEEIQNLESDDYYHVQSVMDMNVLNQRLGASHFSKNTEITLRRKF